MSVALQEAAKGYALHEVPVGAVLVHDGKIIARAHNQTEALCDATAHAEMIVLGAAMTHLKSKYLSKCALYVSLEPCVMCAGAMAWAQLDALIFGAKDPKRGFLRYGQGMLHPKTQVIYPVQAERSTKMLQDFFKRLRKT